eukprot:5544085-Pleurochrysis_carterae.AAC.1
MEARSHPAGGECAPSSGVVWPAAFGRGRNWWLCGEGLVVSSTGQHLESWSMTPYLWVMASMLKTCLPPIIGRVSESQTARPALLPAAAAGEGEAVCWRGELALPLRGCLVKGAAEGAMPRAE